MSKIYRLHYRAQLKADIQLSDMQAAVAVCMENIKSLQAEGKILTAALYYAGRMLFLYYEAVGEPLSVVEPAALQPEVKNAWNCEKAWNREKALCCEETLCQEKALCGETGRQTGECTAEKKEVYVESGEDIQAAVPHPTEFLASLAPFLMTWPGQRGERLWVHMYHIYYHSMPKDVEDWKRAAVPEKRRGRIAFLRDDKLFSYTYYHKAIVDEGLLTGDRYQSIALHENILFSYFEEPKTLTNVQNRPQVQSRVIDDWMAVDPESHFIHMPEGEGENFMFLPALFSMGVEDIE